MRLVLKDSGCKFTENEQAMRNRKLGQ